MVHNETTNVWSHLVGVFIFIALLCYTLFFLGPFHPNSHEGIQKELDKLKAIPHLEPADIESLNKQGKCAYEFELADELSNHWNRHVEVPHQE